MLTDEGKTYRFDYENTSIPTPGNFPLADSEGINDVRAELADARAAIRQIVRHLPPKYVSATPHIKDAMDALNLALGSVVVADMSKTWEQPK